MVRAAAAKAFPMPEGMGNKGFAEYSCPTTLVGGGLTVQLASDPVIAVGRGNEIARRSVAKPEKQGTIKESWAVGDWSVTIGGIIIAETEEDFLLAVDELQTICAVRESVEVTCNILNYLYGITRIAIERLDLPFTPGMFNQQFTITAYSDTSYELLEEV